MGMYFIQPHHISEEINDWFSVYMYNSHNLALKLTVSPVQLQRIKFNSAGFFFFVQVALVG